MRLWLQDPAEPRRPPSRVEEVVWLEAARGAGRVLHAPFSRLYALPPAREEAVQGFLRGALGVWAADKLILRSSQPDAWSRRIHLHLALPPAWEPLAPRLAALAGILTGDAWEIVGRPLLPRPRAAASWPQGWEPSRVALFSGGLDSLIGALDLLEGGHRLLLVSHYDYGQLAAVQQALAAALQEHYGPERLRHLALPVQLEGPELTLRSRSLLYLALGLAAAAAFPGPPPLMIPENGWISVNPPLTLNRLGPLSTRTTHPAVLQEVRALWREAGLTQELHNPYQRLTKGEMAQQCRAPELLRRLAPLSISCARPVAGRWQREGPKPCGYCYPCLVRRAALHRLGADVPGEYRVDVLADRAALRHRIRGRHLRALLLALSTWRETPEEILDRLWRGPEGSPGAPLPAWVTRLLAAGFAELSGWLQDQGGSPLRDFYR